ncbi:carboxymethylenebutenolidase [Mycolicibacterium madagascariense]|uniref:Carboxymethylenebutenolidase n=1 Tax=Mycolicibacterium madagascariense TaxID=212765 RepID=A0A7I7XHW7_9MYCO|nr:dienelactone hydrolase family protein [Mycolicibacterium madagascariense]MCV7016012.1 dienelactone hydrolase family protein [Mycolicibacterium madagascariense]BBZ28675.1 carboxymethylenebutenolidase [Mycolicibacterium madagascariense]
MTPLQRYIAEEIATDHVEGLMSRREAMRRLALIGVGATAASALIAACSDSSKPANGTPTASAPATSTGAATEKALPPGIENALQTEPITWPGPRGDLQAAWAAATEPKGAVLVLHENKGLTDWVRSVAGRFAGIGYSSLAIDLLSGEGGTAKFTDPAQATAALSKISPEDFLADMKSGVEELQRRTPGVKAAAVGFCMGGGLVWQLLASGEPQLAAAVPFYGPLPDGADFSGSKDVAVLAFYGSEDARVTGTKDAAQQALDRAGVVNQLVVEQGANHAFFNDTGDRYDPTAATDAWDKTQAWLTKYVG